MAAQRDLSRVGETRIPIKKLTPQAAKHKREVAKSLEDAGYEVVDLAPEQNPTTEWEDEEDEWGLNASNYEEKTDISRLAESLLNSANIRGKTQLNDDQISALTALDMLMKKYDFIAKDVEALGDSFMFLQTSRGGWAREGLQKTLHGNVDLRDQERRDDLNGGNRGY